MKSAIISSIPNSWSWCPPLLHSSAQGGDGHPLQVGRHRILRHEHSEPRGDCGVLSWYPECCWSDRGPSTKRVSCSLDRRVSVPGKLWRRTLVVAEIDGRGSGIKALITIFIRRP